MINSLPIVFMSTNSIINDRSLIMLGRYYKMPKVQNVKLANVKKVLISNEFVDFDKDGIGEIKSEELYKSVLNLANFYAVEEVKPVIEAPKVVEPVVESPKVVEPVVQEPKREVKTNKTPAKK